MHLLALFMNMEKNVLLYLQFAKSIDDCKNLYNFLKQLIIFFSVLQNKAKIKSGNVIIIKNQFTINYNESK